MLGHHVGVSARGEGFHRFGNGLRIALVEQIVVKYYPGDNYSGPKIGLVVDNYIIHRSKKT